MRAGEDPGAVGLPLRREQVVLLQRQPLVHGVREGRRHYHHRPCRGQRADDAAADHLALPAGEVDGEPRGLGRRRRREEGAGEGEDLEPTVQRNDCALRRGLPQRDVGDGAGAAEHADPALPAARERGDALGDVAAAGHLHDVRAQRVGAVPGDDDRRLGLVLGPRGPAPGPARRVLDALLSARPAAAGRGVQPQLTPITVASVDDVVVVGVLVVALGAAGGAEQGPRRAAASLVVLGLELQLEMEMEVAGVEGRRKMVTVHGRCDRIHLLVATRRATSGCYLDLSLAFFLFATVTARSFLFGHTTILSGNKSLGVASSRGRSETYEMEQWQRKHRRRAGGWRRKEQQN
jgi:hypothetical protein